MRGVGKYTSGMIDVIGAPFDGCGARLGSRLGPAAVELAGLREGLDALGCAVNSWQTVEGGQCNEVNVLRGLDGCCLVVQEVKRLTAKSLGAGRLPLLVGGEHSVSMGGIAASLEHTEGDLAVLWVDAHADVNTPATSPSGHLHGMPLAAAMGLPSGVGGAADAEWRRLVKLASPPHALKPELCAWIGLREVDPGERRFLANHPTSLAITMYDIDRNGMVAAIQQFGDWLRRSGAHNLYLSFDVDVLDPILAPGTGTTVRGGLTYREAHLMAELLRQMLDASDELRLVGLDVVEVNPLEDTANSTAKIVVEWIASLFGKTILGASR